MHNGSQRINKRHFALIQNAFFCLKATTVELLKAQAKGHAEENDVAESVSMRLFMFSLQNRLYPYEPTRGRRRHGRPSQLDKSYYPECWNKKKAN